MIDLVIAFGIGFLCGGFLTIVLMALCILAKDQEEKDHDRRGSKGFPQVFMLASVR